MTEDEMVEWHHRLNGHVGHSCLLIPWLHSPSAVILEPKKIYSADTGVHRQIVIRFEQPFLWAKQKFDPMTKESNRGSKRSFEGMILCSTSRASHPQICMAETGDQSHTT